MGWRDWRNTSFLVPEAKPTDGWRVAGDDVYTLVAPPGFEKDPAVTEAIRSFDPEAIPAWRIQLWHPPGEMTVLKAVHHGILRHYPYPKRLRAKFRVELPVGYAGPEPNFMDVFFEDARKTNLIGPPAYIPWDWRVYRFCRRQYVLLTVEAYRKRVEAHRERIRREREAHQAELDYRRRHFERTALPMLEKLTPADWREYEQLRRTRGRSARRVSVAVPGMATRGLVESDGGRPPGR